MAELYVDGSPKVQASGERIGWTFDWTDKLVSSQTISSATATVTQLDTGADVSATTIVGSVDVVTPLTTVTVNELEAGKRYRLDVLATLSGGSIQVASLELRTPY